MCYINGINISIKEAQRSFASSQREIRQIYSKFPAM